jgi:hypothetical protein
MKCKRYMMEKIIVSWCGLLKHPFSCFVLIRDLRTGDFVVRHRNSYCTVPFEIFRYPVLTIKPAASFFQKLYTANKNCE